MVFSSLLFLLVLLPITLLVYRVVPDRFKNGVLLAASLLFYAWGAPRFVFVLVASCALDYQIGRQLVPSAPRSHRRAWLAFCLFYNLGLLGYFKYANFLVEQGNRLIELFGGSPATWTAVILPIGISFFTFQKISYLLDIYQGHVPPARNVWDYILYIVLFPQLIAGPIVRYHDVARQLVARDHPARRQFEGIWRFAVGLAKKVLVANSLAVIADGAFDVPKLEYLHAGTAWIGLFAYAGQIYFDFSGYSDMAIGLGRLFGFEFLENFDRPYTACNFTEFWRRWHISLSNFMREYLYIPLGGNRVGRGRAYFNLWLVFVVSGFWHGARWNFLIWGCYHGLFLTLDKALGARRLERVPAGLAVPLTFLLVCGGWVFFRAETLAQAGHYFAGLMGHYGAFAWPDWIVPRDALVLALTPFLIWGPAVWSRWMRGRRAPAPASPPAEPTGGAGVRDYARFGLILILLVLSLAALSTGHFNPFIYFQF